MVGVGDGPGVAARMHKGMVNCVSVKTLSVLNPFQSLIDCMETP